MGHTGGAGLQVPPAAWTGDLRAVYAPPHSMGQSKVLGYVCPFPPVGEESWRREGIHTGLAR